MKRLCLFAPLLLIPLPAYGEGFFGRALASYESRDSNTISTSGLRQQYDLRLDKALTLTSLVRLYCRVDDFRGTQDFASAALKNRSRQIQPIGEFVLNSEKLQVIARSEWLNLHSTFGQFDSTRKIQRSLGQLTWQPDKLPVVHAVGSRDATRDHSSRIDLTEDNALASLQYTWRGLQATGEQRYDHSTDPEAGYDRKMTSQAGTLTWASTHFDGKLAVAANGNAQLIHLDEAALKGTTTSVPRPQTISRALYAVDDTPLDDSDHPLAPAPLLIDNDTSATSGISLSPDSVSFQNLAIDLGRIDRVDEIRILVRDAGGNPLQHGGGPVTWDLYTSDDGRLWRAMASQTTFSAPLSLYSVTFDLINARWLKVVNFGVNADPTLVTELQAWFHTTIGPGASRTGTQNVWSGGTTLTYQPVKRFMLSYNGVYNSVHENFSTLPSSRTNDLEHLGSAQYDLPRHVSLRAQYLTRSAGTYTGRTDNLKNLTTFLDYTPTRDLRATLEFGQQDETQQESRFSLNTRALHVTAFVIRSVAITSDFGMQTQNIAGGGTAVRRFFNMTGNLQLAPSLRMLLDATMQRTRTNSTDPAVQLLGAERDDRISSQFIWRRGKQLTLTARYGWAAGQAVSGFTQRYHADWYPFGDGTVSLGGSYDQDIDPTVNRRARRVIFNPRWLMNRWVMLDLNYTSVTTSFLTNSQRQRALYATVTLTR